MTIPDDAALAILSQRAGQALRARGLMLATAESCTGGWIAKAVTDIAGSSGWFECGLVTYGNTAKQALLGVRPQTLDAHGAVSGETAFEMVSGALAKSGADIAVAVTGVAGPGGGSDEKPVGTVWIAWQRHGAAAVAHRHHFDGDREAVRRQTVAAALQGLLDLLATAAP